MHFYVPYQLREPARLNIAPPKTTATARLPLPSAVALRVAVPLANRSVNGGRGDAGLRMGT